MIYYTVHGKYIPVEDGTTITHYGTVLYKNKKDAEDFADRMLSSVGGFWTVVPVSEDRAELALISKFTHFGESK